MSEMFRDPKDGALARRRDLLGRRRDELVSMPHAVRRVVVARWARIAASIAMWIGAEALVIAAVSPTIARWVAGFLPGREPAVLSTLLLGGWLLGVIGYFVARSAAEHRFAVAMSRTVLPGEDLFHDLDRLDQVHPDEVARGMAHGLEVLSAALPIAAAATILPATVGYLAMGVGAHGWPSDRLYEQWLVQHAPGIAASAMLGLLATVIMTKQWARRPNIVPAAIGAAAILGGSAFVWPWLVGPAAIAMMFALVGRRLRIERARIQAEDPAAGSEVFTLRGMIAEIKGSLRTARAFVRWHRRGFTIAAVALPVLLIGYRAMYGKPAAAPVAPRIELAAHEQRAAEPPKLHPEYAATPALCPPGTSGASGCLRIELQFHGKETIDVHAFPGLANIPAGWHAQIALSYRQGTGRGITVVGFPRTASKWDQNPQWLDDYHSEALVETTSCGSTTPAVLRVTPDQNGADDQSAVLIVEPKLALAQGC